MNSKNIVQIKPQGYVVLFPSSAGRMRIYFSDILRICLVKPTLDFLNIEHVEKDNVRY